MSAPQRIQRRRIKGWRMPEGAIYVGRPSKWGNPWVVGLAGISAAEAVRCYREWLDKGAPSTVFGWSVENFSERGQAILDALDALRGHDLVCWCPLDQPCHADVLLALAAGEEI